MDYHLYYQKLRNFHWNIVGENFFDLHVRFEEMYNDAKIKIDDIAERILTLRYRPESLYSTYLEISEIKESSGVLKDYEMVDELLKGHKIIIARMRNVVEVAGKATDEGTIDLIGAYIRELEKSSWMLGTWSKAKGAK